MPFLCDYILQSLKNICKYFQKIHIYLLTSKKNNVIIVKRFALHHFKGRSDMFEKNMRIAYLLDFYADVLDEHIASVMRAYYNDDLSLSEIAQDEGISRQGIRHLIKKGEESIEFFEEKLGLAKRHAELLSVANTLTDIKSSLLGSGLDSEAADTERVIGIILKGNQDVRESY